MRDKRREKNQTFFTNYIVYKEKYINKYINIRIYRHE